MSYSYRNTNTQKTMKQILTRSRILPTIALLVLAMGCANTRSKENSLIAAGFKVSVPKTVAQQQKLKRFSLYRVSRSRETLCLRLCSRPCRRFEVSLQRPLLSSVFQA